MPVTVTPARFALVDFDADVIVREAEAIASRLGLDDRPIAIAVDEHTFLTRLVVRAGATVRIDAGSGAFDDPKHPRRQSLAVTQAVLGRALLRARDRLSGGFAATPADEDLTASERAAWNAYLGGRLQRAGLPVREARWRYDFRNRFGFSDAADAAFDRIWAADDLDWSTLLAWAGRPLTMSRARPPRR